MKKIIFAISLVLLFSLFIGCKNTNADKEDIKPNVISSNQDQNATGNIDTDNETNNEVVATPVVTQDSSQVTETSYTIADFYPFNENTKYSYEGEGNEYASYYEFTDYKTEDRIQLRSNNGGTETVKIIENKNGNLSLILSKGETYYRQNLTNSVNKNPEILLKEPLVKGTEWKLSDNSKRYISNVDVDITTPAGTYKALEVTTEGKEDTTLDYYALNVGLVKSIYTANDTTTDTKVSSSLSKIEENVPFTQTITFYYPDVTDDVIYSIEKKLSFHTNDVTRTMIEEAFRNLTMENLDEVLTAKAKIKSLYLSKNNVVYVDFTKELVSDMNAGSGYEAMILQCITNTLGMYYGVDEVYITLEGSPYESGHFAMNKGETFQVDLNNIRN